MTMTVSKIQAATLSIAVSAGLAPMAPTQAQECSAIQESYFDNLPGCVNPPQNEEECATFQNERLEAEFWRSQDKLAQINTLYNDAVKVSDDIFGDKLTVLHDIRQKKINTAKVVADLIPAPGNIAAAVECLTWHTLKMAGIIADYNNKLVMTFGLISTNPMIASKRKPT